MFFFYESPNLSHLFVLLGGLYIVLSRLRGQIVINQVYFRTILYFGHEVHIALEFGHPFKIKKLVSSLDVFILKVIGL